METIETPEVLLEKVGYNLKKLRRLCMERLEKIINEYILDLLFENNEGEKTIQYIDKQLLLIDQCKTDSMQLLKCSNEELFQLIDKLGLSNENKIKAKLIDCRSLKGKFFPGQAVVPTSECFIIFIRFP